jgi:hypothetical protein
MTLRVCVRETIVKLPRSSIRRSDPGFLKLLLRVDSKPTSALDFAGRFLKPGAEVEFSALRPTLHYPAVPLLLEVAYTETDRLRRNKPGYRNNPITYILWLYVPERNEWREIVRCSAVGLEWVEVIARVAARILDRPDGRITPDETAEISRFRDYLDWRLRGFPNRDQRLRVLSGFHDVIGVLTAATMTDAPPVQLSLELTSTPTSVATAPKRKGPARQESRKKKALKKAAL